MVSLHRRLFAVYVVETFLIGLLEISVVKKVNVALI